MRYDILSRNGTWCSMTYVFIFFLSFPLCYCGSLSSGLWVFSSEMHLYCMHSSKVRDLSPVFGLWDNLCYLRMQEKWDCSNYESAEGVSPGKEGHLRQLLERSHTQEHQDAPAYSCTILRYKMGCLTEFCPQLHMHRANFSAFQATDIVVGHFVEIVMDYWDRIYILQTIISLISSYHQLLITSVYCRSIILSYSGICSGMSSVLTMALIF